MGYIPATPFRRAANAACPVDIRQEGPALPGRRIDKWQAFRELGTGRAHFGLSDRDLTVLQALIGFHPGTELDPRADCVVFPSNRSLCERLNGMACSTMRRHMARLVEAGMILRRDSPNGKRYRRRGTAEAFGLDISPLARRHEEITAAASEARARAQIRQCLREDVSLMRRDLLALTDQGRALDPTSALWEECEMLADRVKGAIRRKLSLEDLQQLENDLADACSRARSVMCRDESRKMSSYHAQSDQHQQRSDSEYHDSRDGDEKQPVVDDGPQATELPPLEDVLPRCSEMLAYSDQPVTSWVHFTRLAEVMRPMAGIGVEAWNEAKEVLGIAQASLTLATIIQRFHHIRSPGAYLRAMTRKAGRQQSGVGAAFACPAPAC